jgi:hypothetical protein
MNIKICLASIQTCEQRGESCRSGPTIVGCEGRIVIAEQRHVEDAI